MRKPTFRTMRDGREVCLKTKAGLREYVYRTMLMWLRQGKVCCICKQPLPLEGVTFEHQDGRGMNGGHRDDRIIKDGKPYNGAACLRCNYEKGSKRMTYSQ